MLCQRHHLIILLLVGIQCFSPVLSAQKVDSLTSLIDKYISTKDGVERHDIITIMMEHNASLSLADIVSVEQHYKDRPQVQPLLAMTYADIFYYANELDSSKVHYLEMAHLASEMKDSLLVSWGIGNYAYILEQEGDLARALRLRKLYQSGMNLDRKTTGNVLHNIAGLYAKLGQLDSASVYYKKTIEIDREMGNQMGLVHDLQVLIELQVRGGKIEEALSDALECVELSEEIGYERGRAMCYSSLAEVLKHRKQYEEALIAIDSSLAIDLRRQDDTRIGKIALIKARILEHEAPAEAILWYRNSTKYGAESGDVQVRAEASLGLAQLFFRNQKYPESEKLLSETSELLVNNENESTRKAFLELSYHVNKEQGKWKEANQILEHLNELVSTNLREIVAAQADGIDQSYDLFKAERNVKRLALEKEINELESKKKANLYMGGGIIFLLTSLLWYYAYQNQKNKTSIIEKSAKEEQLQTYNRLLWKEMESLRSQMNPHFLFNSLNSINDYIIRQNPKEASIYLTKFSKLMRMILNNSKQELITLADELEAVRLYMELEKLRFEDKFDFYMDINPKIAQDQLHITSMLIQPFLENAVKHGMKNLNRKGKIELVIDQIDERLHIIIKDNGVGRKQSTNDRKSSLARKSYGMAITSDRVELLNSIYNANVEIIVNDLNSPSGTEVIVSLTPLSKIPKEWKKLRQSL